MFILFLLLLFESEIRAQISRLPRVARETPALVKRLLRYFK